MNIAILTQIFETCIIPILGYLTIMAINFLRAKAAEAKAKTDSEIANKYIDMVLDTVTRCVITTNQTYVDTLKKQGNFTAEAQKKAFEKTYDMVLAVLSEDAKTYMTEATGDFETYLKQLIESQVAENKMN